MLSFALEGVASKNITTPESPVNGARRIALKATHDSLSASGRRPDH
jgi:hypothetical protein